MCYQHLYDSLRERFKSFQLVFLRKWIIYVISGNIRILQGELEYLYQVFSAENKLALSHDPAKHLRMSQVAPLRQLQEKGVN